MAAPRPDPRLMTRELRRPSADEARSTGLPTDVLSQSRARLHSVALVYAGVFFLAGYFPALLFVEDRTRLFGDPLLWVPGAIAIVVALVIAGCVRWAPLSSHRVMYLGLVFEVIGGYGIVAAEFLGDQSLGSGTRWIGLSWSAVWTLFFTVVVPAPPRRAVVAALCTVSAVPVILGGIILTGQISISLTPPQFFFGLVFPYLLVVLMAYVGARVVYALGTEVTRARELGSYRLVERLGAGGMGEVWRAEHRLLVRPAAIKLIRPTLGPDGQPVVSESSRRRFEREAQVIAGLRSPHTVNLFDFGVASDGAFYYVMELLEGMDADSLVKRTGPMPPERVVHVLRQICHSLSEADSRGLVHRDIKPANIFLCRYGEDCDFVKVLDFGIAKPVNDADGTGPTLTREMVIHGTPAFMAPEQALAAADVDGRADLYAVGCVAYWLLTGQLVFRGDTSMALLLHHARTTPDRPSARTELPIPPALEDIVMACLAKDPAQRPQSARELSHRLANAEGADRWTDDRAHDWWERHAPRKS